jgi:hypothetical protein
LNVHADNLRNLAKYGGTFLKNIRAQRTFFGKAGSLRGDASAKRSFMFSGSCFTADVSP